MPLIILVFNPGSSSLRFRVARAERADAPPVTLLDGRIESIGPNARAWTSVEGSRHEPRPVAAPDHGQAADRALEAILDPEDRPGSTRRIDAVGIRIVAPPSQRRVEGLLRDEDIAALEEASASAPLHLPPALAVIRGGRGRLGGGTPWVAAHDSAFHAGWAAVSRTCAIPRELAEKHGIERVGFHGLAVRSVLDAFAAAFPNAAARRIAVLHLGAGASVTSVLDGRSIDCSMGFSPLEGLVMATRCGDVDPAIVARLASAEHAEASEVLRWLETRSGLLGVSGRTADMREIERLRAAGDTRAALAFDLFVSRARAKLAGAAAALGGLDAVLFSGGIGENSPCVREAIASGMEWCGIRCDRASDRAGERGARRVSTADSPVGVYVVPADEECVIVRTVLEQISSR